MAKQRTKEQLIEILIPAIIKSSGESREVVRARLQALDLAELSTMELRQRNAGHLPSEAIVEHRQKLIAAIIDLDSTADPDTLHMSTTEDLELVLVELQKKEIAQMEEDHAVAIGLERIDRFAERLKQEQEMRRYAEEKYNKRLVQFEQQDRRTFSEAARELGFSVNDANFALVRETLGPGFTIGQVCKMVLANPPQALSPATDEEIAEWHRQDIKEHNRALKNADILTLKKLTREAGARAGQAPPPEDDLSAMRRRDEMLGRTVPLPVEITFQDIAKADPTQLRRWIQRHGEYAVTIRVREGAAAEQSLNKLGQ